MRLESRWLVALFLSLTLGVAACGPGGQTAGPPVTATARPALRHTG